MYIYAKENICTPTLPPASQLFKTCIPRASWNRAIVHAAWVPWWWSPENFAVSLVLPIEDLEEPRHGPKNSQSSLAFSPPLKILKLDMGPKIRSLPWLRQGAIVFDHGLHWNCVWEVLIDVDAAKLPIRSAHHLGWNQLVVGGSSHWKQLMLYQVWKCYKWISMDSFHEVTSGYN